MRNRAGFTLIELMLVVGIVGSVCLFAIPSAGRAFERTSVQNARISLVNLYNSTRMSARAGGRTMVLRVSGNAIVLERNRPTGTAKDTVKMTDLNAQYGVLLAGPDSIRIDSRGMLENSLGTPVKFVFTRGTAVDSVQISRYGRIFR
jgi:prepilin-type N-terminal cleavage/methylation domain-containing protein